jgi:hypothetical protein
MHEWRIPNEQDNAGCVSKLAVQSDSILKMLSEKLIAGLTGQPAWLSVHSSV